MVLPPHMYDLPYHKALDEADVKSFIGQYPFAFLTGCDADHRPVATQLPVFLEAKEGRKVLRGHIMKHTDHHKAFLQNPHVLAVFTGKHTYVSGTWYTNPHLPSTWNYMSVHVKGTIRILDDAALEDVLRLTSLHFEGYNAQSTTLFDHVPEDFKRRVMGMIVAFEIEVQEIDTVFKLSQDRDLESYHNIIVQLRKQGEDGQVIAAEMEKRIGNVFPGK
jgi:transcriptional regulator